MKKKVLRGVGIGLLIVCLSMIGMYFGLACYYADGFSYGTWINDIYCTGMSVNEVNDELLKKWNYEGLTITDSDGKSYVISAKAVGLTFDYEKALQNFLNKQDPYLWVDNLLKESRERILLPVMEYDESVFEQTISNFSLFDGKSDDQRRIAVEKGSEGYYLVNERVHVLNEARTREVIREAFENLETSLDLEAAGCYEDLEVTEEMQRELQLWEKLSDYQNCGITYRFGEELYPIDAGIACEFLKLDENGDFVFDEDGNLCTDEEKVYAFVDRLADEYDTLGGKREFLATRGEVVTVEGGTYGNKLDRKAEKEYLLTAFLEKRTEEHEPAYTHKAWKQGRNDIGDTYIEVDMTEQMLYYYVDGELIIKTPVVTGNTSRRRGTPEGTNYVYNKQKNRVLRGPGYASPVKYWLPVNKGIGIHDASWRSEYGGEIYKTGGSHGCINTPLEEVAKLYEMVEIGTPCVMFY